MLWFDLDSLSVELCCKELCSGFAHIACLGVELCRKGSCNQLCSRLKIHFRSTRFRFAAWWMLDRLFSPNFAIPRTKWLTSLARNLYASCFCRIFLVTEWLVTLHQYSVAVSPHCMPNKGSCVFVVDLVNVMHPYCPLFCNMHDNLRISFAFSLCTRLQTCFSFEWKSVNMI